MQTPKQMAASQRHSLKAIAQKIENMSADWADVDSYLESKLHELAQEVDGLIGDIQTEATAD